MKLVVSNFEESTDIADVLCLFQECGQVIGIKMYEGHNSNFAVVEMYDGGAERALRELDGKDWHGGRLKVRKSKW